MRMVPSPLVNEVLAPRIFHGVGSRASDLRLLLKIHGLREHSLEGGLRLDSLFTSWR